MLTLSTPDRLNIRIDGLEGQASALRLESVLSSLPDVKAAHVNVATGTVSVELSGAGLSVGKLVEEIENLGLEPIGEEAVFRVQGLTTARDAAAISRALKGAFGVLDLTVSYIKEEVWVEYLDPPLNPLRIMRCIARAGDGNRYRAVPTELDPLPHRSWDVQWDRPERRLKRRLWWSFLLTILLLGLSRARVDVVTIQPMYFNWMQFLLATILIMFPAFHFFTNTLRSIRLGCFDWNILVFLSVMGLYGYSAIRVFVPYVLVRGDSLPTLYFEQVAVVITLVLLGRFLMARSRRKTARELSQMQDLIPRRSFVFRRGSYEECDTATLMVGDQIRVRPGERVPVDGVVMSGHAVVDESGLTAEVQNAGKGHGDTVMAGTLVVEGALEYWVTQIGRHTAVAQILRLVREAQGTRVPIQRFVDSFGQLFIPGVIALSALTFVAWYGWGSGAVLTMAIQSSSAVLLIASPVALALAVPSALLAGTAIGSRLGILFRGGAVLASVDRVDTVVFDLHGTLTSSHAEVMEILGEEGVDRAELLAFCASALQETEHAVAYAVMEAARLEAVELKTPLQREGRQGWNVKAVFGDHDEVVVTDALGLEERGAAEAASLAEAARRLRHEGRIVLYVIKNRAMLGIVAVGETIRHEAKAAVQLLRDRGVAVVLVGEEHADTLRSTAVQLGIESVEGDVTGEEKAGIVHRLQKEGRVAAFVSSGIDRGARSALDRADVGIVIGAGAEVTERAGDITLVGSDPRRVAEALDLCCLIRTSARRGFQIALGYNILALPLAAGLLYPYLHRPVPPWSAACLSALATWAVVASASRLKRRFRCAACRLPSNKICRNCPRMTFQS